MIYNSKLNIALVSPSKDLSYETFIQAHRNLSDNIFFYFNEFIPLELQGYGYISRKRNFLNLIIKKIVRKFRNTGLSIHEEDFLDSLKKNKIDYIVAEYGPTGVAILDVCKIAKIPLITIFHGYDASIYSVIKKYKIQYAKLFNESKAIIAVSKIMKDNLVAMGCNDKKIVLAPYGPNPFYHDVTANFSEIKSFVAIGRFVEKKAPYFTLMAFKKVCDLYPESKLYFAGEGELKAIVYNLAVYLGLERNIDFLGIISPMEYSKILSKVLCMIQHSITASNGDMEGTPVAILEASAVGVPVVSTIHAGIPDVIIDGITGFLVEEHDVDMMAERMIFLIENIDLAKKMGSAGKEYIRNNYTLNMHLEKIHESFSLNA